MDWIPQFGNIGFTVLAFVVALSVIVAIHEYGHYIVGRWSGIHADVFSLGFGPVVYSRVDRRGTKWQVAALPFGGYVKFRGDADAASAGKDEAAMAAMTEEAQRSSMHGAPLWARAATVAAGPVFNFILSILIFAGVVLSSGQAVEEPRIGVVQPLPGDISVLEQGDLITAVNGTPVVSLEEVIAETSGMPDVAEVTYTVERDGTEMDVLAAVPFVPLIGTVTPQSAAMSAGLEAGDVIRSINGTDIGSFAQVRPMVDAGQGAEMAIRIWREGTEIDLTLTPRVTDLPLVDGGFETRYLIGIGPQLFFEPETEAVGLWDAAKYGVTQTIFIVESSLSGLWHIITGAISTCNLQGPIGIAETSGAAASQGLENFIWFIAVLSTAVGLLNLFPIPVLDGGHLVFHAYEAVAGKPPSDRALRVFMSVGLTLLLSLMAFALMNDLFC